MLQVQDLTGAGRAMALQQLTAEMSGLNLTTEDMEILSEGPAGVQRRIGEIVYELIVLAPHDGGERVVLLKSLELARLLSFVRLQTELASAANVQVMAEPAGAIVAELPARRMNVGGGTSALTATPDGRHFVSTSPDGIKIWDTQKGWLTLKIAKGHEAHIYATAHSPVGPFLATACEDGAVRVYNTNTGESLPTLEGHKGAVRAVTWSPDGQRIASAGTDGTVQIWDAHTGARERQFKGHTGRPVRTVDWSPDGKRVLSAGEDGTLKLWDVVGWNKETIIKASKKTVSAACYSLDGQFIAAMDWRGVLRVFRVEDSKCMREIETGEEAPSMAWSPSGNDVVLAGYPSAAVRVFDLDKKSLSYAKVPGRSSLAQYPSTLTAATYLPGTADGAAPQLLTLDREGNVHIWDAKTGELLRNPN